LQNLLSHKEVRIVGISDPEEKKLQECGEKFDLKTYKNTEELIKEKKLDAIVISSSTNSHVDYVLMACKYEKHIFCEKPLDLNISRIQETLAVVKQAEVKLFMGFNRRFDPHFSRAALIVKEGRIGNPHLLRISSRDPMPPPIEYIKVSGGLFMDMSIHDFDMARYLLAEEVVSVTAQGSCLINKEISEAGDIDTATIILKFKSGAICTIDNSRKTSYGYDQRIEIFGSMGCWIVPNQYAQNGQLWSKSGIILDLPHHFFLERYKEAYQIEINEFIDSLNNNRTPSAGGAEAYWAALIATAAHLSMEQNKTIVIQEMGEDYNEQLLN